MQITIDTNNLSDLDIAMLAFLAEQGDDAEPTPEPEAPAPKAAKAPKAPKAEPTPEPDDEDLLGGGRTVDDAIAKATELVSNQQAAKVRAALAAINTKKVSEIAAEDVEKFFEALEAEG